MELSSLHFLSLEVRQLSPGNLKHLVLAAVTPKESFTKKSSSDPKESIINIRKAIIIIMMMMMMMMIIIITIIF